MWLASRTLARREPPAGVAWRGLRTRGLLGGHTVPTACRQWTRSLSAVPPRAAEPTAPPPPPLPPGALMRLLGPETAVASEGFSNRWAMMVPAFTTHLALGGPGFGWSVLSSAIVREHGLVCSAATDWSLFDVTMPMPIFFSFLGLTGAVAGNWQNTVGPRMSIVTGGLLFGSGMVVGACGIGAHSLPLLYLGFGVLGGAGTGLCYTPPMQALMLWFPDQKGLAMGCLVAGFGAGGLAFVPAITALMARFGRPPTFLGEMGAVETRIEAGTLYAPDALGQMVAAVQATSADLARISGELPVGLYAVGSGSTGAAEALAIAGLVYAAALTACGLAICRPRTGWLPAGYTPPPAAADAPSLSVEQVMRTPQFYQLGVTFACLTCGIYGIFSVAKGMMSEVFSGVLPVLVTSAFTSSYLMMLSLANLSGRFGMGTLSDRIGCKATYNAIILTLIPIYFSAPLLVKQVVSTESALPLYAFVGTTWLAVFVACGSISTTPAYEAALFGDRNVGAVHGRMLVFNSVAAVVGPNMFVRLRTNDEHAAIERLLAQVEPARFEQAFGLAPSAAQQLVDAKTVTIPKLMGLMPAGTADPTPFLYDSTMHAMGGLVLVAAVTHNLIRPVDPAKFAAAAASK
jgi:hypothetical protein